MGFAMIFNHFPTLFLWSLDPFIHWHRCPTAFCSTYTLKKIGTLYEEKNVSVFLSQVYLVYPNDLHFHFLSSLTILFLFMSE